MKNARLHQVFDAVVWTGALCFLAILAVHEAHAGPKRFDPGPANYRNECGSCHVAYAPALLPPAQWSRVLAQLDRHYGVDASVNAATLATLRSALANSGAPAPGPELPRISTQPWFLHEHRGVPFRVAAAAPVAGAARTAPAAAASAAAPAPSDCAACHVRAAAGDYAETSLRRMR